MPKHFVKVDSKGRYAKFPGFTVVAAVKGEDAALWAEVHDCINKFAHGYFSPLPSQSYHMTAVMLYTEMRDGRVDWEAFVNSHLAFLREIHRYLKDNIIKPIITVGSVQVNGVIQLRLSLSQVQQAAIKDLAKKFHTEARLPEEFHITLAYQYKAIKSSMSDKIRNNIQDELTRIFEKRQHRFELEQANLCYFNDMTAFIPCDGTKNPFERPHPHHHFFKWRSPAPSKEEKIISTHHP